jgi:LSD1 subclass zinc finger protein
VFTRAPLLSTAYFKMCIGMTRVWCGKGIDVSANLSIDVQQWLPAHRSELTNVVKEALECAVKGLECGINNREVAKNLLDFINHLVLTSGSEELRCVWCRAVLLGCFVLFCLFVLLYV